MKQFMKVRAESGIEQSWSFNFQNKEHIQKHRRNVQKQKISQAEKTGQIITMNLYQQKQVKNGSSCLQLTSKENQECPQKKTKVNSSRVDN